jgi:hypothetical protein
MARFLEAASRHFRAARDKPLRAMIIAERTRVQGPFRILDVGGRADYWARVGFDFLEAHDIVVHCLNTSEGELYNTGAQHPRITTGIGDARALALPDNSYDMVHANSVIEHVGCFADKRAFANEVRRLAPRHYVQTPYAWFPIDPHWPRFPFYHWLPISLRQKLLRRFRLGWGRPSPDIDHAMRTIEGTQLLDRSMMRTLFPDSRLRTERLLLLTKSLIAERRTAV